MKDAKITLFSQVCSYILPVFKIKKSVLLLSKMTKKILTKYIKPIFKKR